MTPAGPAPPPCREPQRRIGLTGGIASGKSTVARLLRERFALPVLDADLYARQALAPGTPVSRAVEARYGEGVLLPSGAIDRAALGRIVFAAPAERRWLEERIHPLVRRRFREELQRREGAPVVVLMIPLLFEAGLEGLCDDVWVVSCAEEQQRRRLRARDRLSAAEADERIAAQWPLARKRELADVVIDNSGDGQHLIAQLEAAL
jgi:dephospho-CoA kinase